MSIYLSVKVWNWQNVAYKNYGYNNPYSEIMSDVEFTRLEARDEEKEIDKETNIYTYYNMVWCKSESCFL